MYPLIRLIACIFCLPVVLLGCQAGQNPLEEFTVSEPGEISSFSLDDLAIGSIEEIAALEDGSFLVLDRTANRLHSVSRDGESVSLRLGIPSGTDLSSMATDGDNSAYVMDAYGGRVYVLEKQERDYWDATHTVNFRSEVDHMPRSLMVRSNNIFIESFSQGEADERHSAGYLYALDRNGEALRDEPFEFTITNLISNPMRQSGAPVPAPFSNTTYVAADSEGTIYMSWSEDLEITGYNLNGQQIREVAYPLEAVPSGEEDQQEWLETMDPELRRTMETGMPDYLPVMYNLVISDRDNIWVQIHAENTDMNTLSFTSGGSPDQQMVLPPDFRIEEVRNGRIFGIERGAEGRQRIRVFEEPQSP